MSRCDPGRKALTGKMAYEAPPQKSRSPKYRHDRIGHHRWNPLEVGSTDPPLAPLGDERRSNSANRKPLHERRLIEGAPRLLELYAAGRVQATCRDDRDVDPFDPFARSTVRPFDRSTPMEAVAILASSRMSICRGVTFELACGCGVREEARTQSTCAQPASLSTRAPPIAPLAPMTTARTGLPNELRVDTISIFE